MSHAATEPSTLPLDRSRATSPRFPVAIFLSAFLLFQVQPLMGRFLLPWFGGGPAIWTTCLLFFQVALLAGYAYAHWLASRSNARLQAAVHISLLAISLAFLPILPRAEVWKPASPDNPVLRILLLLAATVGAPYLALASSSPLLQRWFTFSRPNESPYRLYALSNLGSMLALLTYPFLVEFFFRLRTQVWMWSALYAIFAVLSGWCACRVRPAPVALLHAAHEHSAARPSFSTVLFWILLPACGSTLLLAATNQMCQEIAVIPFLWIVPLAIYLLTFILCFADERWYRRLPFTIAGAILAPASCAVIAAGVGVPLKAHLATYALTLFVLCIICHGELARSRPHSAHLTLFYLMVAAGGALGGVFVAVAAPRVFTGFTEYPIGVAAACLLATVGWLRSNHKWPVRTLMTALLVCGAIAVPPAILYRVQPAMAEWRNFYGILRVTQHLDINGPLRLLTHGRIQHGFQYVTYGKRTWATSYYGPHSGVGIVLNTYHPPHRRVGVIGLGVGTIAAYGQPGDVFRFYDINPDVKTIATGWFSFLKDSKAQIEIVLGDARVQLERELADADPQNFDVLAVDAFSSDAIPIHLLTAECADVYRRHLKPEGVLLLHISNRSLDLQPVTRALAQHLGWQVLLIKSNDVPGQGESSSDWVLITTNANLLAEPAIASAEIQWDDPEKPPILWTDDFSSLWHVLKPAGP